MGRVCTPTWAGKWCFRRARCATFSRRPNGRKSIWKLFVSLAHSCCFRNGRFSSHDLHWLPSQCTKIPVKIAFLGFRSEDGLGMAKLRDFGTLFSGPTHPLKLRVSCALVLRARSPLPWRLLGFVLKPLQNSGRIALSPPKKKWHGRRFFSLFLGIGAPLEHLQNTIFQTTLKPLLKIG